MIMNHATPKTGIFRLYFRWTNYGSGFSSFNVVGSERYGFGWNDANYNGDDAVQAHQGHWFWYQL